MAAPDAKKDDAQNPEQLTATSDLSEKEGNLSLPSDEAVDAGVSEVRAVAQKILGLAEHETLEEHYDYMVFSSHIPPQLLKDEDGQPLDPSRIRSWVDQAGRIHVNVGAINHNQWTYNLEGKKPFSSLGRPIHYYYEAVADDDGTLKITLNAEGRLAASASSTSPKTAAQLDERLTLDQYQEKMYPGSDFATRHLHFLNAIKNREIIWTLCHELHEETNYAFDEDLKAVIASDEDLLWYGEIAGYRLHTDEGVWSLLQDIVEGAAVVKNEQTHLKLERMIARHLAAASGGAINAFTFAQCRNIPGKILKSSGSLAEDWYEKYLPYLSSTTATPLDPVEEELRFYKAEGEISFALHSDEQRFLQAGSLDYDVVLKRFEPYLLKVEQILGYRPDAFINVEAGRFTIHLNDRAPAEEAKNNPDLPRNVLWDTQKRKELSIQHVSRMKKTIIKRLFEVPFAEEYLVDNPHVALPRPLGPKALKAAREKIIAFATRHGGEKYRKLNFETIAVITDIGMRKTDKEPLPVGHESRKVYLAPPYDRIADFLEVLYPKMAAKNIQYIGAKIHQGGLQFNPKGQLVAQRQNTLCFHFRDDYQFDKFYDAVIETEAETGIKLLAFPNALKYGQLHGGKINFGIDAAGTSYDHWCDLLCAELKKTLRERILEKNARLSMTEIEVFLTQKIREWLQDHRANPNFSLANFFDVQPSPLPDRKDMEEIFASVLEQEEWEIQSSQSEIRRIKNERRTLEAMERFEQKIKEACAGRRLLRLPFSKISSTKALEQKLTFCRVYAKEIGYECEHFWYDRANQEIVVRFRRKG